MMKMMCRHSLAGVLAAACVSAVHAEALDAALPDALLADAQKEGKVTVYSFTSRIAKVEKAFEEAYPGIDVQAYDISSTEQIARLKAEAKAGTANQRFEVIYPKTISKKGRCMFDEISE